MAGGSISEPGVEVVQEFVTTNPTVVTPTLPTAIIGPCIQVVDAFDDNGSPQASALAGTYRNGYGVISYVLPGLKEGASLDGYEDDARVFLVYGDVTRELNSEDDEVVVTTGSNGVFTLSGLTFTSAGALFEQDGAAAGDFVRFTYRGASIDLEIDTVDSETQVTLVDAGDITEASLTGLTYSMVRNPAEFVFASGAQASLTLGTNADYITFTVQTANEDFSGADGDTLAYLIRDSQHYAEGSDGAAGDAVFGSASQTFTSITVDDDYVPDVDHFALIKATNPPTGAGQVLRQVMRVVNATTLAIETGTTVGLSSRHYRVGSHAASGTNGVTNTDTSFSSAGASFTTTIPNTAGTPDTATFIEIEGDGVYGVTSVDSNTALTLTSATAGTATGLDYEVITQTHTGTNGTTGALTTFASPTGDFSALTSPTAKSINHGETEAKAISSVTSAQVVVLSSGMSTSFVDGDWSSVDTTSALNLTYDSDAKQITVHLARASGMSSNTYNQIEAAITSSGDSAYNATVADIITATTPGAGTATITGATQPLSGNFDGGSDEHNLLLDADLMSSATPTAQVYTSYRALRLDVSDQADGATLLEFDNTDDVEERLGPISIENPLALGVYFALLNSPSTPVKGVGISETSATKPDGTAEAYTSALEFLEGYDVYTEVVLTQDPTVHAILQTHVDAMSEPENKSERIGFFNQDMPTYSKAEVIASGVDGNTGSGFTSDATAEFSASVDFDAAGVEAGDILVVSALGTSDDSPNGVNGTSGPLYGLVIDSVKIGDNFVLVLDGTASGVSSDWDSLVDVSFTVYRAGSAVSQPVDQAEEVAKIGEGYADRRMYHHWPDLVTADVDGTEQIIEGFYVAAAWGGKVGQLQPEQPFTNTTVAGFTGVKHSNGYFSRAHLDRIAGGGTFISVQDSQSSPLRCRHQLSTDVSTIQKRELSITKVVDYAAKFMRLALIKHTGKFNITQSYLDGLATVIQGLLRSLIDAGRVADCRLLSLAVDEVESDKIQVKLGITVFNPANYIVVTIQI